MTTAQRKALAICLLCFIAGLTLSGRHLLFVCLESALFAFYVLRLHPYSSE